MGTHRRASVLAQLRSTANCYAQRLMSKNRETGAPRYQKVSVSLSLSLSYSLSLIRATSTSAPSVSTTPATVQSHSTPPPKAPQGTSTSAPSCAIHTTIDAINALKASLSKSLALSKPWGFHVSSDALFVLRLLCIVFCEFDWLGCVGGVFKNSSRFCSL